MSEANTVDPSFGQGLRPSIGYSVSLLGRACFVGLFDFAILSIMTGILRRRWLGLVATGLTLVAFVFTNRALDLFLNVLYVLAFLVVLIRVGLIAAVSFSIVYQSLLSPPLDITQWYAGLATIALLVPLSLLA